MSAQPLPAMPAYFGVGNQLFGLFHGVGGPAQTAVLLCPPFGQDLIRSHRVYRQLAEALAGRGIPSLRFDYFGSGDSSGDSVEVDWLRCQADALTAAAELRRRSGCQRLVGFGGRLGGSLVLACATAAEFAELIVWDPVVDGAAHVAQLDALQDQLRLDPMRFSQPRSSLDASAQWLGFPVDARLHQQLSAMQITTAPVPTLILDSRPPGTPEEFARLQAAGARMTSLTPATIWNDLDRLEHAVLSPGLIRAVLSQLGKAA